MATFRINAAVVLFAASIPALATPTPWASTPNCAEVAQQALYALPIEGMVLDSAAPTKAASPAPAALDRSELLAAFAMTLRDIRYRRGGRAPKTGFDCSGFVQYVYQHALGVDLPANSASQYRDGTQVARSDLRTGDLVFFHIRGKRVSHVGIYLDDGRFIHSPSTGKRVRVDDLHDTYWSRRYAGARRPNLSA